MKDIEIGMVTGPLGIRGEVKIKSYAEDPARFKKISEVALRIGGKEAVDYKIEHARISGGMVVVKFAGIDDRNAAELLRNADVFMDRNDLEPLKPGQHYIRDLIGMTIIDDETGEISVEQGSLDDWLLEDDIESMQQGIQGITEDTAGALEAYMNGVSQQVYYQSDLLSQIRDAVVGFNLDVQVASMSQILLQLRSSYEMQTAIHSMLEGWSSPNGMSVRVEMV